MNRSNREGAPPGEIGGHGSRYEGRHGLLVDLVESLEHVCTLFDELPLGAGALAEFNLGQQGVQQFRLLVQLVSLTWKCPHRVSFFNAFKYPQWS